MPTIVVHGGAGASKAYEDGCVAAAQAGMLALRNGAGALEAAVAAVVLLENDGRFNAGIGSKVRSDGVSVQMDAAVMDSTGLLGAVAGLQTVRNPVQVARAVAATPQHLLCGEGALRFARQSGYAVFDTINNGSPTRVDGCDTVGAVVRDSEGRFAVAGSTGGASPSPLGRVGDTPIIGAGFYAGPKGAVAATGIGEHIMRHLLAREVYQWLADGIPLPQALQRGLGMVDHKIDLGLIAVTASEAGSASNRDMPAWTLNAD
ncbi:L-asparaginase [Duganella sp. CY15W]|uniref:isoaspartyl peptidase/L-asparaginase n=1 Tax=Duganella sp. CY15W TaxID=2692172 RepID=UPI001368C9E0|nr:isoaspartyl peptidase/L-asparaginase [Duganella sp. CY15W]MYM27581.1 L-asparaginase [Duganella sp. CY15W]